VNGLSSSFITLLAAHNKIHTIHIHKIIVLFHDCSNSSIDFVWRFQGPRYGLRLTLNVQKYENIPFLDLDSGVKARPQFSAVAWLQIMRNRCCLDLDVISLYQDGGRGRSILFPVSHLLISLPSEGQSLLANQILSTYLNWWLRYNYFRFWQTNVRHIAYLL